jgi:hypothetical protein
MSLRTHALALAVACLPLCLPVPALAADPHLRLPAFDHLRRTATESVNITIGHGLLSLATFALKHDKNPQDQEALEVLSGIKGIYIRSYEFSGDNMYSQSDIDAVRAQLSSPGWSPLVEVRKSDLDSDAENVDVFVSVDDEKVNGFAIVASGPRRFTIVNIVGTVDLAKLAQMQDSLGLPSLHL